MSSVNQTSENAHRPVGAIILAAGQGKRMNSDLPKVAHAVAGEAMVCWVVRAVREIGADPIVLVVGHGAEVIRDLYADDDADIAYVTQTEQRGTGHATNCASDLFSDFAGDVFVLAGDGPLIRSSTLSDMLETHRATQAQATLGTAIIDDPTGYGRVTRDESGRFSAIVEHKSCTPEQLAVREVYPSYAVFDSTTLFHMLEKLEPNPVTDEYYLTDVPGMLRTAGRRVELVDRIPPEDVLSINTPQQLAEVEAILISRMEKVT